MPLPDTEIGQAYRQMVSTGMLKKPASSAPLSFRPPSWGSAPAAPTPASPRSGYLFGGPSAPRPAPEPFNGAMVMSALADVQRGVQRGMATAREFGIGAGVSPQAGTPGARAFQLGGATPTQSVEPFFRRPKWWPR